MIERKNILVSKIDTNRDVHARVGLDEKCVNKYARAMLNGEKFTPIWVAKIEDDGCLVLVDGFHRLEAHKRAFGWYKRISARVFDERLVVARVMAITANKDENSLPRTEEDKKNALRKLFKIIVVEGAPPVSIESIAKTLGVSPKLVQSVLSELTHFTTREHHD